MVPSEVTIMPVRFTDDQKRWLIKEYPDCTRQHIFSWENGTFPGPKWMPIVLKVTGMTYEEIHAMYPEQKTATGNGVA